MVRVRANIGLKRVTVATRASQARATKSVRSSMQSLVKGLQNVVDNLEGATPEAIAYGLQPAFDLSQTLVPRDTGALADSGYLEVTSGGRTPRVEIGYGRGGYPSYAAFVHENLQSYHEPPTQAKFLEAALSQKYPEVRPRIIQFLRRRMNG